MTAFPRLVCLSLAALVLGSAALAEEKNGLSVTVSKTTLDRADQRSGYYYDRIDRTQGLKATIKNTSFKPMPEGTVDWQILVRKYYSSDIETTSGTEKLKALKPAEIVDMVIGSANIKGWRDSFENSKDKLEWQVIVKQEGKEVMKVASTSSFDALAKRAVKVSEPKR